jgi:hypothetical protein
MNRCNWGIWEYMCCIYVNKVRDDFPQKREVCDRTSQDICFARTVSCMCAHMRICLQRSSFLIRLSCFECGVRGSRTTLTDMGSCESYRVSIATGAIKVFLHKIHRLVFICK